MSGSNLSQSRPQQSAEGVATFASLLPAVFLIAFPWIYPATWGPKPAVVQLLISWGCLALAIFATASGAYRVQVVDWPRIVVFGWIIAAAISIGIALVQFLGLSDGLQPWVSAANPGEAFGNLRQRNQFASLNMLALAAWCWADASRIQPLGIGACSRPRAWVCNVVVASALGAGTALSASRVGFFELLLLMVLAVVWRERKMPPSPALHALLGALLTYGFVTAILAFALLDGRMGGLLGRFDDAVPSCTSRLVLWGNVVKLIGDAPWTGWGWGELDYAHFVSLYPAQRFCEILDNAHDLPLHLAVELGLPAATAFCGIVLFAISRLAPWRETVPLRRIAWSVLAVLALHSMVEYPLWYGPFQVAAALCVVVLCKVRSQPSSDAQSGQMRPTYPTVAVAAAVVLLGCAYGLVAYWRIGQIYLPPDQRAAMFRDNTLQKIRSGWMFHDQVRFAELSITAVRPDNAETMLELAKDMLHFSPEPIVVEKLLDSALLLRHSEELDFYLERFKRAFPKECAQWMDRNAKLLAPH